MRIGAFVSVQPIYGWGWMVAGNPSFQVPEPFQIRVDDVEAGMCSGLVVTGTHAFAGRRVRLIQRHEDSSRYVNIEVAGQPAISGYGEVE